MPIPVDTYTDFWTDPARQKWARDMYLVLRHGHAVNVVMAPGDMTEYRVTLIPIAKPANARAYYTDAAPRIAIADEPKGLPVVVKLDNCGAGWGLVNLGGAIDWTDLPDLGHIPTSEATQRAIAGMLDAIATAGRA